MFSDVKMFYSTTHVVLHEVDMRDSRKKDNFWFQKIPKDATEHEPIEKTQI